MDTPRCSTFSFLHRPAMATFAVFMAALVCGLTPASATVLYPQNVVPDVAAVPAAQGAWDDAAQAVSVRMATMTVPDGGTNSSAIGVQPPGPLPGDGAADVLVLRAISQPLDTQTISGTLNWVIGVQALSTALGEDLSWHLHAYVCYKNAVDCDTVRGTLVQDYVETLGSHPWPATAQGWSPIAPVPLTSTAVQQGDRIVIEVGYAASAASALTQQYIAQLWYDGAGATDLEAGGTDVTGSRGHFDFSDDVVFAMHWVPGNSGGGGDFGDAAHWAAVGSSTGGYGVPDSSTNVYFDESSFTQTGQTVTTTGTAVHDMDWSAVTNSPTFTTSWVVYISGSLTFAPSMILNSHGCTLAGSFYFGGSGTVNAGGLDLNCPIFFGTYTFTGPVTASTYLGLEGTVNTNGQQITARTMGSAYGWAQSTSLGASEIHITQGWTAPPGIFDAGTSTFVIDGASASFSGGGRPYHDLQVTAGNSLQVSGANSFNSITLAPGAQLKLPSGVTTTLTSTTGGGLLGDGTAGSKAYLRATTSGSAATLNEASGQPVSVADWDIKDSHVGGASFTATSSTDSGNNQGWTFVGGVTATPTGTPTFTRTRTATWTFTPSPLPTLTPTPAATFTFTPTSPPSPTWSGTPTSPPTLTRTATVTWTFTNTATPTPTPTATPYGGHLAQLSFETDGLAEASATTGPCTRTNVNCASGTGCYRWNPEAASCNVQLNLPTPAPTVIRAFARFRVASFPTGTAYPSGTGNHDVFDIVNATDGTGIYVGFNGSSQLQAVAAGDSGSTTCTPLTTSIDPNVWYALRLYAVKGSNGSIELDLLSDGGNVVETKACVAVDLGGGSFTAAFVGSRNAAGQTGDINFDDIDIHDGTAWPGNVRWVPLAPTSTVSCEADESGCSPNALYDCVSADLALSDGDGSYLSWPTPTPGITCVFGHTSAAAAGVEEPIHGAELWLNVAQDKGVTLFIGRLNSYNASFSPPYDYYDTGFFYPTPGASYSDAVQTEVRDPATKNAWTLAGVDGTAVGFSSTGGGSGKVSTVGWIVGYEAPTATMTAAMTPTPTATP